MTLTRSNGQSSLLRIGRCNSQLLTHQPNLKTESTALSDQLRPYPYKNRLYTPYRTFELLEIFSCCDNKS